MNMEEMVNKMSVLGDVAILMDKNKDFYISIAHVDIKDGRFLKGIYTPAKTIYQSVVWTFHVLKNADRVVVDAMDERKRKEYRYIGEEFILIFQDGKAI